MKTILYFSPTVSNDIYEIESMQNVVSAVQDNTGLNISIVPSWTNLITLLQTNVTEDMLIVLRLDYLERENISLDDTLLMINTLTKFVSNTAIGIALVVNKRIDYDEVATLKRNNILGIIPGMRFFESRYSFSAYKTLASGEQHWPAVAVKSPPRFTKQREIKLTNRERQVFTLVTQRGLTNRKIAEQMSISEDTVKGYVSSIMKKYGVKSRTQLTLSRTTTPLK
jgi:DNA-binding NarL/FixJ family response regulator